MSQFDFGTINPDSKNGTELASDLNSWRDALLSMHRGNTRPSYAVAGMDWIDDTTTPWQIKKYTGTIDVVMATFNATTGVYTPIFIIADDSISTDKLQNGAVTNAKLAFDGGALSGFRNVIINGNFSVNQRAYASGAAVGTGLYGHDRWKMAGSADTYTFSTTANITTVTIPAGKVLQQVIEGLNLQSGTYVLSWTGTAQGKIGAGSYGASGIFGSVTGGSNLTIEFGPGTISKVQFELGATPTPFEARPIGTELALCQRYYAKTYPINITPGTTDQQGAVIWRNSSTGNVEWGVWKYPVEMRTAPTITTYSIATGASGKLRQIGAGVDKNASTYNLGTGMTAFYNSEVLTGADTLSLHATASAEL